LRALHLEVLALVHHRREGVDNPLARPRRPVLKDVPVRLARLEAPPRPGPVADQRRGDVERRLDRGGAEVEAAKELRDLLAPPRAPERIVRARPAVLVELRPRAVARLEARHAGLVVADVRAAVPVDRRVGVADAVEV